MRLDKISKTKINNAIFDIVLYLILILLATGMVAGFGGSTNIVVKAEENGDVTVNESGYPITNKEITVTVSGPKPSGLDDWTQLADIEEYAKRLGIRLDCNFYETDWETQLTLMVAGDELPDLLTGCNMNIGDVNEWGGEGYFLDLSQYLDEMPNLQAYFEKYPEMKAFCSTSDGHIYGLPRLRVDMTDRLTRSFVNKVWLENLGLSGLTSDVHSERETSIASPVQNGIMVAVNANTQYPEAMARFLDYFYTDEGMLSATKGYEGITFDMVQDELLGIEVPEMKVPDGYTSGEEYRYKGSVLNEALNLVERNLDREALFNADQELLEKPEIVEKYGWAARVLDAYKADGVTGVDCYPVVSYTTEEIEERSPIYKDLSTYLQQAKAQFITGELDVDQDWDTYVNTVEQMNAGRLLEIEQAAYDRFAALKG